MAVQVPILNATLPWLRRLGDLFYPRNCLACQTPLAETMPGVICPDCLATAKRIAPPFCRRCALPFPGKLDPQIECGYCLGLRFHFSRAVAGCRSEGIVRDCIHRLKYNRELYYLPHLAGWLIEAGREWVDWSQVDAIVPVPLHPFKQRTREFNQAELLARELGRQFGKPVLVRAVRRVKDTQTQTHLDAKSRRENLRGAFLVPRASEVSGRRLVIVDDVFTTGATLDNCARVLVQAGAADVITMTVARGV